MMREFSDVNRSEAEEACAVEEDTLIEAAKPDVVDIIGDPA